MLGGWKFANFKDGSFAEFFHVNQAEANLALIPDSIPDDQAVYMEPADRRGRWPFLRRRAERMSRLLRLLDNKRVDPAPLTTHPFNFENIEKAFHLMESKEEGMIKPLIAFGGQA